MARIVLTTLNARYIHTAFGLRYLYANLGELQADTALLEFGIKQRPVEIVERLLLERPDIIGFGVYIWNVAEIGAVVAILKRVSPDIVVVLGGPEVSHPPDLPDVASLADYVVTGPGEADFLKLCRALLADTVPPERIIAGQSLPLSGVALPYRYYSDHDLRQRITYVEASRGCPFKCEFCLSSLDVTAKAFPQAPFLAELDTLFQRGARHFKFIDRTFNLKVDASVTILEFFLERLSDDLYLHFEVIPDHLPERLKAVISKFPPGILQFEVGVQTFEPAIQQRISRQQDNVKTEANLNWLRQHSQAHIHADLIAGLPGDTLEGFGRSFDRLWALGPQEIQVGILKRLRGAPIHRHDQVYAMRYDPNPPYAVLSTRDLSFADLQRLNRFARYWDLIGNSGRFRDSLSLILADRPFDRFLAFSDALYQLSGSTWQIALKRLYELTFRIMTESLAVTLPQALDALERDFLRSGEKSRPDFLRQPIGATSRSVVVNKRQQRVSQADGMS